MQDNSYKTSTKIFVAIAFISMVVINGVGNLLPLNGMSTGAVSDSYPNIFAPAGLTFAVWGVIYALLLGYSIYQFGPFKKDCEATDSKLMNSIAFYFIISSLANAAWIFSWHFKLIPLSMLFMAIILICLIFVNSAIKKNKLSNKEKFFLKLPFSVYFGWITVATIANATVLLVSLGWNGFGISETVWATIIIFVGTLIGVVTMLKNRDIVYGLVLIWAYLGILIKHTSASGFNSQYTEVITVVVISILLFVIKEAVIIMPKIKKKAIDIKK